MTLRDDDMTPVLAVIGSRGQLGRALMALPPPPGWRVQGFARPELDVTDPRSVTSALAGIKKGVVVNATAYTAVDQAEAEPELSFAVNEAGAGHVAACGLPVIHVSTDFVFDGDKTGAYDEGDPTSPLSVYGASKLAGEKAVAAANPRHLILRTAWVFSGHGKCFPRTIFRLLRDRPEVAVVDDQFGSPTSAEQIAAIIRDIAPRMEEGPFGLFNLAGQPALSRFDFARAIAEEATAQGFAIGTVIPRKTDPNAPGAKRPVNSELSSARFAASFGMEAPDWRAILPACVKAYGEEP